MTLYNGERKEIEIRSSWNGFETLFRITRQAQEIIWSLFAIIHMKSWPKVKLGQVEVVSNISLNHSRAQMHMESGPKVKLYQVGVDSNIAQNHSSKSCQIIIYPNSHEQ